MLKLAVHMVAARVSTVLVLTTSSFSSTLVSATNKVYQSLAKLIKLCDDVLLQGEKALDKENVTEVIHLLEDAVQVRVAAVD
jgi:hypothetical protein